MYLEWAPANVLSESSTSDGNKKIGPIVGEHDAKKAVLEQYMEGISDVDVDPDRVEVWHLHAFFSYFLFAIHVGL